VGDGIVTLKNDVVEKFAIVSLLFTIAISTIGSEFQVGAGFRVDTMEMCKSYEVDGFDYMGKSCRKEL